MARPSQHDSLTKAVKSWKVRQHILKRPRPATPRKALVTKDYGVVLHPGSAVGLIPMAIEGQGPALRQHVVDALEALGYEAIGWAGVYVLAQVAKEDSCVDVRRQALRSIQELDGQGVTDSVNSAMLDVAKGQEVTCAMEALETLGIFAAKGRHQSVESLLEVATEDQRWWRRAFATHILVCLGAEDHLKFQGAAVQSSSWIPTMKFAFRPNGSSKR